MIGWIKMILKESKYLGIAHPDWSALASWPRDFRAAFFFKSVKTYSK